MTVPPSRNACRGVPFVPTRYAATIAFPCPGVSAWAAPQKAAISSDRRRTPTERSPWSTSASNPPGACSVGRARTIDGAAAAADPSAIVADALETSSGELSWSDGYFRRRSLALVAAASVSSTRAPSRAVTVTSRQPMRPGNDVSSKSSSVPAPSRAIHDVEAQRLEPSRTRTGRGAALDDAKRHLPSVERQNETACEARRIARLVALRHPAGTSGSRRDRARSGRRSRCPRGRCPRSG